MAPTISPTEKLSAVTLRKVTWRLIPFLFVLYVIAWLDRVNVGFAGLQMNTDLGFSSTVFGLGSGIFFLGYCLFEIPSNIILERVGARLWIARIMVTWGLISAGLMLVRTPLLFYVLRFLLGVAEAGFFPGVIYYLSLWYPDGATRASDRGFHDSGSRNWTDRRPVVRSVAWIRWRLRPKRLAVVVSARRPTCDGFGYQRDFLLG